MGRGRAGTTQRWKNGCRKRGFFVVSTVAVAPVVLFLHSGGSTNRTPVFVGQLLGTSVGSFFPVVKPGPGCCELQQER